MSGVDWSEEETKAVQCLLSHSGSCYLSGRLDGPPQDSISSSTVSRWENIRPSAEYNLTDQSPNSIQRKQRKRRRSNHLFSRHAISLPNLRPQKRLSHTYMSGKLDENFSYVYTGGLSERACSGNDGQQQKVHHVMDPLLQGAACGHSYSTQTLTLDTGSVFSGRLAAQQIDLRMRREISQLVAMQLRPEVLAEQIILENRLRNLELNAYPVLGARSESGTHIERGYGMGEVMSPKSDSAPPTAEKHWAALLAKKPHRKKKQRKTTSKPSTFEWCPMGIQDYSSTDFRLNAAKFAKELPRRESLKQLLTTNSPKIIAPTMSCTSTGSNGTSLSSVVGVSALSKKQMVHLKSSKNSHKLLQPNDSEEKSVVNGRTLSYYGQKRFAVDKSGSGQVSSLHAEESPGSYRVRVPVIVPQLKHDKARRVKHVDSLTTLNSSSTA